MKKIALSTLIAATLVLSGCATDQMKQDIADAKAMATEAQAAAAAAQSSADDANARAMAADDKAESAMNAASDAQACCSNNSEKIDRMFHKAMMK